jgi:hypothetical protein
MDTVLALLKELGGRASVAEISELGRKKAMGKDATDKVKIRDSLIRLRQKGIVSGNPASKDYVNEVWTVT